MDQPKCSKNVIEEQVPLTFKHAEDRPDIPRQRKPTVTTEEKHYLIASGVELQDGRKNLKETTFIVKDKEVPPIGPKFKSTPFVKASLVDSCPCPLTSTTTPAIC